VTLPVRTLPIDEHWDCHGCGDCCYGTFISLTSDDLERFRRQEWKKHPDYRGVRILVREGLFRRGYRIAQRPDRGCVFLTSDARCRIHLEHGPEGKPLVCRQFPLQLVPLDKFAYLWLRRTCPSAAAGRGRKLRVKRPDVRESIEPALASTRRLHPPKATRRDRRPWGDVLQVADTLQQLLLDDRYPLVRRLVHGLQFCDALDECRLKKFDEKKLGELLEMLAAAAVADSGEFFADRPPPRRSAAGLFRQTAIEYLRLHPACPMGKSWRARGRLLRAAFRFVRAAGQVPDLGCGFPETTFQELERPLGHLGADVLRPLVTYFEASAIAKQYAMLARRNWSLTDGFRGLALSYPAAMWLLRFACGQRPPQAEDTVAVVRAIDRGEGFASLVGPRQRLRISGMSQNNGLVRLVAWYAQ
jgi:lysine-N-methylase